MTETTTSGHPALTICRAGSATAHPCTRPVGTESLYLGEPPTLCAEHYRSAHAAEEAADWQSAHDAILEGMGPKLDPEHPGQLERVVEGVLDEARRETARAYLEYEMATWMAGHDHETDGPRPLSGPEDLERGYRLLTRSDGLLEAFYALYGDGKDLTPKKWKMLGVIQEAQQEVSAQFDRWRGDRPGEATPPARP